jgi:hypothetical protein
MQSRFACQEIEQTWFLSLSEAGSHSSRACGNVQVVTAKELKEYFAQIGRRGGKARVKNLTPEQRKASARKAAQARWANKTKKKKDIDSG